MKSSRFLIKVLVLILLVLPAQSSAQPVAPNLTLNGIPLAATVNVGEMIHAVTEPDAFIDRFPNATCSGLAEMSIPLETIDIITVETTYSYQARWATDGPTSTCLTGTWLALPPPPHTGPPPLTLNGVAGDVSVDLGVSVYVVSDSGARISLYEGAGCAGTPFLVTSSGENAGQSTVATVYSYRAHWFDDPSLTSSCLTASWVAPARTEAPPLTANGSTVDIEVYTGTTVSLVTDPLAVVYRYASETCTGPAVDGIVAVLVTTPTSPTVFSASAHWPDQPELRSACLKVSVIAPVETAEPTDPVVTAEPSVTVPAVTAEPSAPGVPTGTEAPVQTVAPAPPGSANAVPVTGLPSTGSGSGSGLVLVATSVSFIAAAFALIGRVRRHHRNSG